MSASAIEPAAAADAGPLARTLRAQIPPLDALRGVAILLVLAHRFNVTATPRSLPARLVSALLESGWVGVQLFFVLSGFLITGILLDSRGAPSYYRAFFARRVLRIFPLYYGVLAVAFVVLPLVTGHQPEGYQHQAWLWSYLSNWVGAFGIGVAAFPHFWSLAVEEQFYLVWPFLVRVLTPRGLARLCGAVIVVALASRIAWRALGGGPGGPYELTWCRADALALGALAAWALREPSLARWLEARQRALAVATLALFVIGGVVTRGYPRESVATQTIGYSILAWLSVVALVLAVLAQARGGRLAALLAPAPLCSIGKYSYAMYVFHVILHHEVGVPLLARRGQSDPSMGVTLAYAVGMTALTYLVALASYHLLEKHFLGLKRYFPVARAA